MLDLVTGYRFIPPDHTFYFRDIWNERECPDQSDDSFQTAMY